MFRRLFAIFLVTLVPSAASAAAFENVSHGAIAGVEIGTTPVGDLLFGVIGGQASGVLMTHGGKWMHQWQGLVVGKGGKLAAAETYTTLLGGRAKIMAESGWRFQPDDPWSIYLGLRLGGDLQVMMPPGVGFSELNTLNNIDGVGNLNASGLLRLAVGSSFLQEDRAVLISVFLQGAARAGETYLPKRAFLDLGFSARIDFAKTFALTVDTLWGTSGERIDAAHATTDVTTHSLVDVDARKVFSNGMWLGGALVYGAEADVLQFQTASYKTRSAPTFSVTLLYGFPLGKQEAP